MANDFLVVVTTKQLGSKTVRLANMLREVRELTDLLIDGADHLQDGVTYTTLETQFGLESGKGANFLTLLGNLRDILNTNATVAGATRLANIDEFVSRLAGQ